MRDKVIIGNWKMNKTISETKVFLKSLRALELSSSEMAVRIGIAPTYLSLPLLVKKSRQTAIYAQNVHFLEKGAYTGEVSAEMLLELGVQGSLVGHSERRLYDNETNDKCRQKISKLLSLEMDAVYCVGETLQEYEAGKSKDVVKKQLHEGLSGISENIDHLIIAYEPVWSIGTGVNASVEIAEQMCKFIRDELKKIFNPAISESTIILYGGSVKPENIKEYLASLNIDGALVGGASLKPESFDGLIKNSR